jgi:hypothetical protein
MDFVEIIIAAFDTISAPLKDRVLSLARDGAATPALRAAQLAPMLGFSKEERAELDKALTAIIEERREKLISTHILLTRLIEQTERVADADALSRIDQLAVRLGRIKPEEIPTRVEALANLQSDLAFTDFPAAWREIETLRAEIDNINEVPRARLNERLGLLPDIAEDERDHISNLIATNDFVTAEDCLALIEAGDDLPRIAAANTAFRTFFPGFVDNLDALPSPARSVAEALAAATSLPEIMPERMTKTERAKADEILSAWRALSENLGKPPHTIPAFFETLGLPARITTQRKDITLIDFDLPASRGETFLLPDFGTIPKDLGWRIKVSAKLPNEAVLTDFCSSGSGAYLLIVTTTLDRAERRRLAAFTLEKRLKLLVIDEAAMLFTALSRQARPTLVFEICQPFGYSEPYKDHGGSGVPTEIFVGRELEIQSIINPHGSCVVYGGRRLGKTATLQQAVQRLAGLAAPSQSLVQTAYIDIHTIGKADAPDHIYQAIAAALPAVFGKSHVTRKTFREKIKAWLDRNHGARILVLLDESDHMVSVDGDHGFPEIQAIKSLMDETARRFKCVLAGNRDITRFVPAAPSRIRRTAHRTTRRRPRPRRRRTPRHQAALSPRL